MDFDRLAEVFDQAARQKSQAEVNAFLDVACRDQPELRRQVESLLATQEKAADFLEATVLSPTPRSPKEDIGDWIGRYRLLQKLGEGGCGVVYMAEQREPIHRRVALKVIKLGMDTQSVIARFEAERQALARMEHPNVAKVFDAGVTEIGRPYFVMELVRGVRITEYCDTARLATAERLQLFIKVCHAIQHAHQKGVVHRDIKPANIMVTVNDGVPVPKVIDFGIAKAVEGRLTDNTLFTAYEQFLGTPAYMSPEQATMTSIDIDTRSDVYSLGVLLYELLTGKTPFDGKDLLALGLDEMLRTIREKDPVRPSTRIRQSDLVVVPILKRSLLQASPLSADLDWIVMKCLEKDRARRYETANELASDIGRYLSHELVLARPPSTAYRLQRAFRRNRGSFVTVAIVLSALLIGISVSTWQAAVARREALRAALAEAGAAREAKTAREERDRARRAQAEADRGFQQARRFSYVANLNVAAQACLEGNLARVRGLLQAQVPATGQEDLRDFEWRYLWKQSRNEAISTRQLPRIPVFSSVLTPDGTKLITSQLYDHVRVFEAVSLRPIANLSSNVFDIDLSRDGRSLAVMRNDGPVEVYDVSTLRNRLTITNAPVTGDGLLISADGGVVAVADTSRITLWNSHDGRLLETIPIRPREMGQNAFAASSDWSTFLTSDAKSIHLWDRATRSLAKELPGHEGIASSAAFSPDGRWLATGGWRDYKIRLWDREANRLAAVFTNHIGWIGGLDFSPDGTTLASSSSDHTIRLWDLRELKPKAVLRGHADEVWPVQYSADGRLLVSGDRGGGVSLWNATPPPIEPTILEGDFVAGSFSSDSRSFLTVTRQGTIQTWDGATLREIRMASVPVENLTSASFSADGSILAVGMMNGRIWLHDLTSPRRLPALSGGSAEAVRELRFSADGSRLSASTASEVWVWNMQTGTAVYNTANPADSFWKLTQVALSPDGTSLAFGSADLSIRVIDLATGSERRIFPDLWGVHSLAFSPDGQHLVGAGRDHRVKVWRTSDGQEVAALKSWRQGAAGFVISPNSRRLAVMVGEGGVQLIDLITGQDVGSFLEEREPWGWGSFSPDELCLAVRTGTGFRFWRTPSLEQIASAEAKVVVGLQKP